MAEMLKMHDSSSFPLFFVGGPRHGTEEFVKERIVYWHAQKRWEAEAMYRYNRDAIVACGQIHIGKMPRTLEGVSAAMTIFLRTESLIREHKRALMLIFDAIDASCEVALAAWTEHIADYVSTPLAEEDE